VRISPSDLEACRATSRDRLPERERGEKKEKRKDRSTRYALKGWSVFRSVLRNVLRNGFSLPACILSRHLSTERLICEIRDARFAILFSVSFRPLNWRRTFHQPRTTILASALAIRCTSLAIAQLPSLSLSLAHVSRSAAPLLSSCLPAPLSVACHCTRVHFRFPVLLVSAPVPLFARTRSIHLDTKTIRLFFLLLLLLLLLLFVFCSPSFFSLSFFSLFLYFLLNNVTSHSCLSSIYAVRYDTRLTISRLAISL